MNKLFLAAMFSALAFVSSAKAEVENCTEIVSLPTTITAQGIYCLKQNLNVNLANGAAITVNAGNVVIEFNGWRVNNQADVSNTADALRAFDRKNITVRNGFVRGFFQGIDFAENTPDASQGHTVEEMKFLDSGRNGIRIEGAMSVVRNNRVLNSGLGVSSLSEGIYLENANDSLVSGNIVSGVLESSFSIGIYVNLSHRVHVTGNIVTSIGSSPSDTGVMVQNSDAVTVASNRLLNETAVGDTGIVDIGASTNLSCLDNHIGGYVTATSGCDASFSNRTLFN